MKTIVIEDDVYGHLVRHTRDIGESASSILRRLLGMGRADSKTLADVQRTFGFLKTPELFMHRNMSQRYLFILSWAYRKHEEQFGMIATIEGSRRKYFSMDLDVIQKSGKNVNPRQIPDSPYWASTNNSTAKKREILSDVFGLLGYEVNDVNTMIGIALAPS
jgi:negative modulator of initiation of replication